jgi:hypothetical protein
VSSEARNPAHHGAAKLAFLLRTHAYRTTGKQSVTARCMEATNPRKEYYRRMYPDDRCPYGCGARESTLHMLQCEHNPDRTRIALALWERIYTEIHAKQDPARANTAAARALYPFALAPPSTEVEFWERYAVADPNVKTNANVARIAAFPPELGAALYVPKHLRAALRAMHVTDGDKDLARKIALRIHDAALNVMRCRRRYIDKQRHQHELYRHFVLGQPQDYVEELLAQEAANAAAAATAAPHNGQAASDGDSTQSQNSPHPTAFTVGVDRADDVENDNNDNAEIESHVNAAATAAPHNGRVASAGGDMQSCSSSRPIAVAAGVEPASDDENDSDAELLELEFMEGVDSD